MLHSQGGRSPIYKLMGKMAPCAFSCTSLTADQQYKLNEREKRQKLACDKKELVMKEIKGSCTDVLQNMDSGQ